MNILTNFKGQKKKKICNHLENFENTDEQNDHIFAIVPGTLRDQWTHCIPSKPPRQNETYYSVLKKYLIFHRKTHQKLYSVFPQTEWQNSRLFQAFFPEQIKKKIHSKIKTKSCYQCHFKTSLTLWWLTHGDFQPVPNISVCLFSFFLTSTFCLILKKNLYLSQAQAGLAHFPVLFPDLEEALQNFKKLSWLSEHMGTLCIEPRHRVQWQCGTHTLLKLCHDLAQLGENLWVSAGKKKNMIKK